MPCSDNFNYDSAKNNFSNYCKNFTNAWTIKQTHNSSQLATAVNILAGYSMHIIRLSINECGSMQGNGNPQNEAA